jgi:hypothetical protein
MKLASQLSHEEMEQVISQIQAILWLDMGEKPPVWDPDNEWDSETIEWVAAVLDDYGLRPSKRHEKLPVKG